MIKKNEILTIGVAAMMNIFHAVVSCRFQHSFLPWFRSLADTAASEDGLDPTTKLQWRTWNTPTNRWHPSHCCLTSSRGLKPSRWASRQTWHPAKSSSREMLILITGWRQMLKRLFYSGALVFSFISICQRRWDTEADSFLAAARLQAQTIFT